MSEANIERLLYGGPTPRVKLRRRAIMLAVFVVATTGAYVAGEADAHGTCTLDVLPYYSQSKVKGKASLVCGTPHYRMSVKVRLIRTPVVVEHTQEDYHTYEKMGVPVNSVTAFTSMPCYRNWQYKVMAWADAGTNGRHDFGPVVSEPVVLC